MSNSSKAIIIGSGIAGIAAAIRLAVQGLHVDVFEKNDKPGGKLSHINLGSYNFDAGPSLFTQPNNIEELFELANEPIEQYFEYKRVPVTCKYFYEDGTVVNAFSEANEFAEELRSKVGEDPQKVISYLQQSREVYDNIGTVFLDHSLHKRSSLFSAPLGKAIAATKSKYLFKSLNQLNEDCFDQQKTIQLFNRYATYNGSNPYKAPGMLSIIPHLELNQGTFYPKGGMISITNALYKLAVKKGVHFHFNNSVERIINHEGVIKGVVANNTNYYADVVVSNMDVYFTYKMLLREELKAEKILKQERSSSGVIFYWGISKEFDQLGLHNIFFSNNYKEEFDTLFNSKQISNDPTVYVNITSKMEADHAPAGKENWFVLINAPANVGQNWEQLKLKCRAAVIAKLSRLLKTDIELLIETEQVLDPIKIEQNTASYKGSLYGTSSNSKMAAFFRHPNFASSLKGLYFAGGSVHPGGGIPLCLKSAKLASEMIRKDHKKLQHH